MVAGVVPLLVLGLLHTTSASQLQPSWSSWGVELLQGRRLEMEDRVAVLLTNCSTAQQQPYRLWAVYDGHGGSWVAQALSEQLLPAIQIALCNRTRTNLTFSAGTCAAANDPLQLKQPVDLLKLLKQQFAAVDDHLLQVATSNKRAQCPSPSQPEPACAASTDAGSTALVLMLVPQPDLSAEADAQPSGPLQEATSPAFAHQPEDKRPSWSLFTASVGNSRAILCRTAAHSTPLLMEVAGKMDSTTDGAASHSHTDNRTAAVLKALRRRQQYQQGSPPSSSTGEAARPWAAVALTPLHEAGNAEEAGRVQAAGGTITHAPADGAKMPRLAGELEVTRAFGDLTFRSHGLIAVPDVAHHPLQAGDQAVVLASDGVFEVMTPQEVCDHVAAHLLGLSSPVRTPPAPAPIVLRGGIAQAADKSEGQGQQQMDVSSVAADSLTSGPSSGNAVMHEAAVRIVQEAYDRGSSDNLASIVIDLRSLVLAQPEQQMQQTGRVPAVQAAAVQASVDSTAPADSYTLADEQQVDTSLVLRECTLLQYDQSAGAGDVISTQAWQAATVQQVSGPRSILQRAGQIMLQILRATWQVVQASFLKQQFSQHQDTPVSSDADSKADVVPLGAGTLLSCPAPLDDADATPVAQEQAADASCELGHAMDRTGLCTQHGWMQYKLTDMLCHTPCGWPEGHYHWYAGLRQNTGPQLLQLAGTEPLLLLSGDVAAAEPSLSLDIQYGHELQHRVPSSTYGHHLHEQHLHMPDGATVLMSADEEGWISETAADWWGAQTYMWDADMVAAGAAAVQPAVAGAAEEGTTLSDMAFLQEMQQQYISAASSHQDVHGHAARSSKPALAGMEASKVTVRPSAPLKVGVVQPVSDKPPTPAGLNPQLAGSPTMHLHTQGSRGASSPVSASFQEPAAGGNAPKHFQSAAPRTGRVLLMSDDVADDRLQQVAGTTGSSGDFDAWDSDAKTTTSQPAADDEQHRLQRDEMQDQGTPRPQGIQDNQHLLSGTALQATGMASGISRNDVTHLPRYQLDRRFGAGHFGEVWLATALRSPRQGHLRADSKQHVGKHAAGAGHQEGDPAAGQRLVLKRVFAEQGDALYQAGLREVYFGQLLSGYRLHHQRQQEHPDAAHPTHPGLAHMAQFVEAFYTHRTAANAAPMHSAPSRKARARHAGPVDPGPSGAAATRDLWLVFEHAGKSLHDLMYEPLDATAATSAATEPDTDGKAAQPEAAECHSARFQVMGPSRWWWGMRQASHNGTGPMQHLLKQLLLGLDALQSLNVTHRDIKTDNLMLQRALDNSSVRVRRPPLTAAGPFSWQGDEHLSIIDFGSALDSHTLSAGMWGNQGPGASQTTAEYAPPEALFARFWEGTRAVRPRMWAYDMWSVGVVWLEMLLGTPDVWALPASTRALLDARLNAAGRPTEERATAYLLRGLQQWCISPPSRPRRPTQQGSGHSGAGSGHADGDGQPPRASPQHPVKDPSAAGTQAAGVYSAASSMVSWACSDSAMHELIRARDPTGLGLGNNMAAVNLLRSLLAWSPAQRPTAQQALSHPYLTAAGSATSAPMHSSALQTNAA